MLRGSVRSRRGQMGRGAWGLRKEDEGFYDEKRWQCDIRRR